MTSPSDKLMNHLLGIPQLSKNKAAAHVTAMAVINWLNDHRNHDEATVLLDDYASQVQVELLDAIDEGARDMVVHEDDDANIAAAIHIMGLLRSLIEQVRESQMIGGGFVSL